MNHGSSASGHRDTPRSAPELAVMGWLEGTWCSESAGGFVGVCGISVVETRALACIDGDGNGEGRRLTTMISVAVVMV